MSFKDSDTQKPLRRKLQENKESKHSVLTNRPRSNSCVKTRKPLACARQKDYPTNRVKSQSPIRSCRVQCMESPVSKGKSQIPTRLCRLPPHWSEGSSNSPSREMNTRMKVKSNLALTLSHPRRYGSLFRIKDNDPFKTESRYLFKTIEEILDSVQVLTDAMDTSQTQSDNTKTNDHFLHMQKGPNDNFEEKHSIGIKFQNETTGNIKSTDFSQKPPLRLDKMQSPKLRCSIEATNAVTTNNKNSPSKYRSVNNKVTRNRTEGERRLRTRADSPTKRNTMSYYSSSPKELHPPNEMLENRKMDIDKARFYTDLIESYSQLCKTELARELENIMNEMNNLLFSYKSQVANDSTEKYKEQSLELLPFLAQHEVNRDGDGKVSNTNKSEKNSSTDKSTVEVDLSTKTEKRVTFCKSGLDNVKYSISSATDRNKDHLGNKYCTNHPRKDNSKINSHFSGIRNMIDYKKETNNYQRRSDLRDKVELAKLLHNNAEKWNILLEVIQNKYTPSQEDTETNTNETAIKEDQNDDHTSPKCNSHQIQALGFNIDGEIRDCSDICKTKQNKLTESMNKQDISPENKNCEISKCDASKTAETKVTESTNNKVDYPENETTHICKHDASEKPQNKDTETKKFHVFENRSSRMRKRCSSNSNMARIKNNATIIKYVDFLENKISKPSQHDSSKTRHDKVTESISKHVHFSENKTSKMGKLEASTKMTQNLVTESTSTHIGFPEIKTSMISKSNTSLDINISEDEESASSLVDLTWVG